MAASDRRRLQPQQQEEEEEGTTAAAAAVVLLRCFDGGKVAAPAALAGRLSGLVAAALAAGEGEGEVVVDVPGNVGGPAVAKVGAYWEARAVADDGAAFDAEFLAALRHDERVDLIHAAHHLGDAALLGLFRLGAPAP